MKKKFASFLLVLMILAACAPTATATEQTVTQPPIQATEAPANETPTLAPTTAPSLQVGDTYSYIDGTNLAAVPAGEFTMGGNGNDNPGHPVTLNDYWVFSTLVTNQQYTVCVQIGECTLPDPTDNPGYGNIQNANDPVTGVTYDQAVNYCTFVGGRLPSEAEWEKAAGGTQNLLGSDFEWVSDWYDPDYYKNSPSENPSGPENGTTHVVRSGSDSITSRNSEDPQAHRSNMGFRCVVDQPKQFAPLCEVPLLYDTQAGTSTCPTLEVKQVELCAQNFPYTNVSVSGAKDVTINSETCTPTNDPITVSCQPPSTIAAQAPCQVDISGNPTCQAGYSLQGNTCVADGAPGSCPAGLNFDSSKQCCGLPSGSDASLKPMVCPVGTFYVAGQNACMPNPVQELVTVSVEVGFKSCAARPGSGDSGSCQARTDCPWETHWSGDLCCCVYDNDSSQCSLFQ